MAAAKQVSIPWIFFQDRGGLVGTSQVDSLVAGCLIILEALRADGIWLYRRWRTDHWFKKGSQFGKVTLAASDPTRESSTTDAAHRGYSKRFSVPMVARVAAPSRAWQGVSLVGYRARSAVFKRIDMLTKYKTKSFELPL